MKEYKIIRKDRLFKSTRKAMEKAINELAKEGWVVVSVSFTSDYGAFATLSRDIKEDNLV